jgi:Cdc6-like AAA superfamily ATPase
VDEFDRLFLKEDEDTLGVFSLFTNRHTNLILVGTSNSMEFIRKVSTNFETVLPTIKNVVFSPYTSEQFEQILNVRLRNVLDITGIRLIFQNRCLRFISCKMYNAKGGDIRKILDEVKKIVKSVIYKNKVLQNEYIVSFEDVSKICSELVPMQKNAELIKSLPLQEQLVLVALHSMFEKGDVLEADVEDVCKEMKWVTKSLSLGLCTISSIKEKMKSLEAYGFVGLKDRKGKLKINLRLCASDITEAF